MASNDHVGEIELNTNNTIVIQFQHFKGKHYLDIRKHYFDDETKSFAPTKKGISIRIENLTQLKKIIEEAIIVAEKGDFDDNN